MMRQALLIALAVCVATCLAAKIEIVDDSLAYPTGKYCGNNGPWYSSVDITSDTTLTITVTGPHSGYVPHSTCKGVAYNMSSTGYMDMPESFSQPDSCIGHLRRGNNGILTLTYNHEKGSILLGVRVPSTDVTMTHSNC